MKEKTLFGEVDKVADSIKVLKEFEPEDGYWLAFSGGKDSCVIKALADMAGVNYTSHYSVTTIDYPELIYFIKEHHPDAIWERPKRAFLHEMVERGFPCRPHQRWCCADYKEKTGSGIVITGVRREESATRADRKILELCFKDPSKRTLNPIIFWTDDDVWSFLKGNDIPYCSMYDDGYKRLGCMFCPFTSQENRTRDAERYPGYVKTFRIFFNRCYNRKVEKGSKAVSRWKDGDDMFDWWLGLGEYSEHFH